MIKYYLKLFNNSAHLDLTKKKKEIESALREIRTMKVGLTAYLVLEIESHSILLEVREINDRWHQKFGNILANEYTMRRFCDEENRSRMFKWQEVM